MSDSATLAAVPVNENIPPPQDTTPASEPATIVRETVPSRRRSGGWVSALCMVLALVAAAVALAAPGLRPHVAAVADEWLGAGNSVTLLVAPPPELDAGWRQAREEAAQRVNAQLADYNARLDRLAVAQQAMTADLARATAQQRTDHASAEALTRSVEGLQRQTRELSAAATAIDNRVRAAGLLSLTLRLRRDVDAGMPIDGDVGALVASGPFTPAIDAALRQLRGLRDGVPTMRDLGDEFDTVIGRLAARSDGEMSWASRGWARVSWLLGGSTVPDDARLLERLRSLANDGRFSEAAGVIMASNAADIGKAWAARVRARATAVVATQALLGYALAAYENAFAATGTR